MEARLTTDERKAIQILTRHEPTIGLRPTVPTKTIASELDKSETEVARMIEDLRHMGFISPQSDVLDGRDDPANHKWIWVTGPMFENHPLETEKASD